MKARVLPVIAVGAAVVAVLLAVLAWRRTGAPAAATGERGDWRTAWTAARECILGTTPASPDPGEAIAAADLVVPERTCARELIGIARAAGDADGKLDRAIGDLADAFGKHVQRRLDPDEDAGPDPLPRALAEVEAQATRIHGELAVAAAKPMPRLTATPLTVDGEIAGVPAVWRGSLYVSRPSDEQRYEVRWVDGFPLPLPLPLDGADTTWSPRGTWQVFVDNEASRPKVTMQNDSGGQIVTIATSKTYTSIQAVIGEGANRMVVFRDGSGAWLARSTDDGHHWAKLKLPVPAAGSMSTVVSTAGDRLELVWSDEALVKRLALMPAEHATGPLPAATTLSQTAGTWIECAVGGMWLLLGEDDGFVVRRTDASGPNGRFKTQPFFQSCSADKATLIDEDGEEWECDGASCKPLPARAVMTVSSIVGADVVRFASQDGVVAVWRGDRPAVFARLPGDRTITGVMDGGSGKAIAILASDKRTEYVELPR